MILLKDFTILQVLNLLDSVNIWKSQGFLETIPFLHRIYFYLISFKFRDESKLAAVSLSDQV